MRARIPTAIIAVVPALAFLVAAGPAGPAAGLAKSATPGAGQTSRVTTRRACPAAPAAGWDECLALLRTTADGKPLSFRPRSAAALPLGYGPAQLQAAYQLASAAAAKGSGQTVALVAAYDDPGAESDLAAYRAEYGLPPCTTASGCFRKVNQDGVTAPLPPANAGWAVEESLDIEMVSAICPRCHILLAEANDNQDINLAATVATAARLGATQISNSYGAPEYPGETRLEPFYHQPGVQVTAAGGDSGYGVSYPAASASVTAVGGTTLWPASNSRGWTESAWPGTGSGCSAQIRKPAWQHDLCTHRTVNDVAAVADPATPVAFYDVAKGGWVGAGGTSVGSPIVAAFYALTGHSFPGASYFYTHPKHVFDVTSGVNGTCHPAYLCTARTGYDGPTGMGTPNFTGAPPGGVHCTSGWVQAPPQQTPSQSDILLGPAGWAVNGGVDALSRISVWTAGTYLNNQFNGPAGSLGWLTNLEHWNGSKWSQTPSPDPVAGNGFGTSLLEAVSFDRPSDGWAVGYHSPFLGGFGTGSPLVLHWNGARWSMSPVLDPTTPSALGGGNTTIDQTLPNSVAAVSPRDVWLAGTFYNYRTTATNGSFIEHWDGSTWRNVSFPGHAAVELTSLHAFSANDIWAVGTGAAKPLIIHWDGHAWSQSRWAPNGKHFIEFIGVSGSSPDDVWAVGDTVHTITPGGVALQVPFTEHWDGRSWAIVRVPDGVSLESPYTQFNGVAAISPSDAWAVGLYPTRRSGQEELWQYLLEHWDGHSWTFVRTPQPATPVGLNAVSASSASNAWIAGNQQLDGNVGSYAAHNGCGHG